VRWLGERRAALAGLGFQALSTAAIGLASTGSLFWAANLLGVVGPIYQPALQSMMTAKVAPDEQGGLQGAIGSISSLTSIVAPIPFTQLFAWTIAPGRPAALSGATMLLGAGLCVIAWVIVFAFTRTADSPD
jgi:DHA1 family tetracycline resistance protein-like MFS transporter